MILHRLVEHYDRLAADPAVSHQIPKPGYSEQKVSFCVVLNPDGTLHQFQSLLDAGAKRPVPRRVKVPGQSKPSGSGFNPCFLWDSASYMLGCVPNDGRLSDAEYARKSARAPKEFEAFREKHLKIEPDLDSPAYQAVCRFLEHWTTREAAHHAAELSGIAGSFGVFRIAGQQRFIHDDAAVVAYWLNHEAAKSSDVPHGLCLVTGVDAPIARLHEPKIKGVTGAQSSGALLVSFNDEAYTSLGKDQNFNAPVSVGAAFKYTNALNHVLNRPDRRMRLGDATVIFWAERPTRLERFVSDLLADIPEAADVADSESKKRAEEARLFMSQLREGHAGAAAFDPEDLTRFFILALSPNASRISVRFWVDSSVGELKERLGQHLRDVQLLAAREDGPPLTIRRIVLATGRADVDASGRFKGYDTDSISPLLAGAIARAVLTGGPYPQTLLHGMFRRLRADGEIRHERVAAIKACLTRNSRLQGRPREVPVALDTARTEPAYVTGRLFALLEKIQTDSVDGELNATIKDRYFSAASATPSFVFPRLIRLSQHHLAKMEPGRKIYYEIQLGEAMNKLRGFAHHLGLEDQGLFAVGYYHQRQDLYTSKKSKDGEEE